MRAKSYTVETIIFVMMVAAFLIETRSLISAFLPVHLSVYELDYLFRGLVVIALLGLSTSRRAIGEMPGVRSDSAVALLAVLWVTGASVLFHQTIHRFLYRLFWDPADFTWPPIESEPERLFDLTVGLLLVAITEELIFRKFARRHFDRQGLRPDQIIFRSGLLFGLIHWEQGVASVLNAWVFGALAMAAYIQTNRLWVPIVAHYIVNLLIFGGWI